LRRPKRRLTAGNAIMLKPLNVLYISYDGMLEPLGQGQVLAYLEVLAAHYRVHLISFEKPTDVSDKRKLADLRTRIGAAGILWTPLTYHKAPSVPATAWDIFAGAMLALYLTWRHQVRVVHARSYVAALMGLVACRLSNARFLFDIRGFWVDERVDGGIWPANGRRYRTGKTIERILFRAADHIVTLTNASAKEIKSFPYLSGRVPPISVIPTCADLNRFCPGEPKALGTFVMGYLGSVGSWYLFDRALECFKALRQIQPDPRMYIVNRSEHDLIRDSIDRAGIELSLVDVQAADHEEVAPLVRGMSVGVALIKPAYSKIASAPTKLAEYLGCGVPCLGNAGVGDMEEILEGEGVGIVLTDFSEKTVTEGMKRLVELVGNPETAGRCREVATRLFSLNKGVERYRQIYEGMRQGA
jgi:glycosyltransferase involved in cell wall biosynthesis